MLFGCNPILSHTIEDMAPMDFCCASKPLTSTTLFSIGGSGHHLLGKTTRPGWRQNWTGTWRLGVRQRSDLSMGRFGKLFTLSWLLLLCFAFKLIAGGNSRSINHCMRGSRTLWVCSCACPIPRGRVLICLLSGKTSQAQDRTNGCKLSTFELRVLYSCRKGVYAVAWS